MPLDLGAAVVIPAIVFAAPAARRLQRAAFWTWLMGWALGIVLAVSGGRKR